MLIKVFGTEFLFTAPFFCEGQWKEGLEAVITLTNNFTLKTFLFDKF